MSPAANDPVSTGPADFREASQDSQRTVDDPSRRSRAATPSAATRIRCPSCHSPIQLADDRSDEVLCPVCGSSFRVQDTRITTTTSGMRRLGKFQLLERVGVGGFGAVWKARDTELDRLVALKLAHAGLLESDADRQRFFREARAAAQLRHPNIVTVHEVASLDGLPALVAEFVEGVSLRDYLQAKKFTFREAASLIAQLADALDYAHSLGIVHRDVKPGNVMLAEPKSGGSGISEETTAPSSLTSDSCPLTPLLMDFGLALRLDAEVTLTVEGQVLGTPAYMSPEQAAGLGHQADRRSDVYSLGVVLYEMLCGEMPFRGSKAMVLHQVLHDEPRPPRRLNDKVPRDLQTICLKAMAKSPARRYATARALADDLRRFLRGEPILARPVGMLERAAKWVRRDPALAGAMTAVVAVLLAGTAVSTYFGFDAKGQAELARSNEATAKQNEADAITARNDLAKTNETLETTLARSLLRPLGAQSPQRVGEWIPLTDAEVEALWELTSTPEETLRLHFIAEGIRNPATTRQLRNRAALALHAVVGLDSRRREEVERRLRKRLTVEGIPEVQRIDLALTLAALDELSAAGAANVAAALTRAMAMTADQDTLLLLSDSLSVVVARMEPAKAAEACSQAAASLTKTMSATKDANALHALSQGLSAVAARMEPGKAAESCTQAAAILTQAMTTAEVANELGSLSNGLSAVAARMEPEEAARAAASLTKTISATKDVLALWRLSEGLIAVAARLEPEEAAQAAASLTKTMSATKDSNALVWLSQGLSAVAARMESGKAAEVCTQAAASLTQAMTTTKDAKELQSCSHGLSAVVARMEPGKAAESCAQATATLTQVILTQAMNSTKGANELGFLSLSLSAVAVRLEPEEAARAAVSLNRIMSATKDANALQQLSRGLSAVAARMEPGKAAQSCAEAAAILTQAMTTAEDANALGRLSYGLSVVSAWMEPGEAARAAASLAKTMSATKNAQALQELSQGLRDMASRMEPGRAAEACARGAAILIQAMNTTKTPYPLQQLSWGLLAVASRMEPAKAAEACAQAATILTQNMNSTRDVNALRGLSGGLSTVVMRMEPGQAFARLTQAMTTTTDAQALRSLSGGLSWVGARMEPGKTAESCIQAAANLIQAMTTTKDAYVLQALSQGLSALAARMEPERAAECCARAATILTQARNTTNFLFAMKQLPEDLSAVLAGVDRPEQERRIVALTRAIGRAADGYGPLAHLPLLRPALELPPCRLSTQQLVELLKHPLFVNEARRVVLDQLGNRYGRHFVDLWEFVAYAREHEPNLDLTTPPQRPQLRADKP